MKAYVGEPAAVRAEDAISKGELHESISRLCAWLERNDYHGYDTFDGLNARFLRPLTFDNKFLRTLLQQGVRRFPINTRPLLGIAKSRSSKGMGFLARGFIRLHQATGNAQWQEKAEFALQWLIDNQCAGYSGACWGNHFDYQSRTFYLPKNVPTVVWTSLIGHAFLDAYEHYRKDHYLRVAASSCEHILRDLDTYSKGGGAIQVHNANCLAASLLARTYRYTRDESCRVLAQKAVRYTIQHQRQDSSWYYGDADNLHWVDNFHTAYVLDSLKWYIDSTGDVTYHQHLMRGYDYWKNTFFLRDGSPKYYDRKAQPLDIQCCSQAIDTFVFFSECDSEGLGMAQKIAQWTIDHLQDPSGYFYYRRYSRWLVNRTPTLHWGQATMLCALAGLHKSL
jgi:hypothetical protein